MRSALISAAFAAGALAVPGYAPPSYGGQQQDQPQPHVEVHTEYDVVYATEIITITAGIPPPPSAYPRPVHYGHNKPAPAPAPAPTSEAPAPAPTYEAPPPTYEAPSPPPTYEAPSPPPTYEAPPSPPTYEAPPPPASSTSSASSPVPTGGSGECGGQPPSSSYSDLCLWHHNLHRCNHTVPPLQWSDSLAATAQKIANLCVYAHNVDMDGGGYGQNIAAGVPADNITAVITDLFYNNEEPIYAQASNGYTSPPDMANFDAFGHFTQIVWGSTTHVGCATASCPNGLANTGSGVEPSFTVCNYIGPGNYAGQYTQQINSPKGEATCFWNTAMDMLNGAVGAITGGNAPQPY